MKRLKMCSVAVVMVACILLAPMKSLAGTNCLNVRDYGYHRHNHRVFSTNTEILALGATGNGYIHCYRTDYTTGLCVCGEYGTDQVGPYSVYVPIK